MSYEEQYERAVEDGQDECLSVSIFKFEKPGDRLVGEFKSQETMSETKFGNPVQRYIISTEQGLMSVILGQTQDKELSGKLQSGDLLAIQFQGHAELPDGKTVNRFDIRRFGRKEGS